MSGADPGPPLRLNVSFTGEVHDLGRGASAESRRLRRMLSAVCKAEGASIAMLEIGWNEGRLQAVLCCPGDEHALAAEMGRAMEGLDLLAPAVAHALESVLTPEQRAEAQRVLYESLAAMTPGKED